MATIGSIISLLVINQYRDFLLSIALITPFVSALVVFYSAPSLLRYSGQIGDLIVHLSAVNKLVEEGLLPNSPYPALYIDAGAVSLISSVKANVGLAALSIVSYMCFVLISVSHARLIGFPIAGVLLFAPVVSSISSLPALLSYSTLFVIMCFIATSILYEKQQNWHRYWILSLPIIFVFPLAHPLVAINFVTYAGITIVFLFLYQLCKSNYKVGSQNTDYLIFLSTISAGGIWLWIAYGRPNLLDRSVGIVSALFLGIERPEAVSGSDISNTLLGQYGYSIFDVVILIIKLYGDTLIMISVSGIIVLALLYLNHETKNTRVHIFHTIIIIFPPIASVIDLITNILSGIGFLRVLRPSLYVTPVVTAGVLLISQLAENKSSIRKFAVLALAFCVATTPILIAGANYYNNPSGSVGVNSYRSDAELAGYSWFFSQKSRGIETKVLWRRTTRVAGDLLSEEEIERRSEMIGAARGSRVSDHLGNGTLGNSTQVYYVQGTRDREMLLGPLKESGRLSQADIAQIDWDPTTSQLYANGNVNISIVYPTNQNSSRLN